MFQPVSLLILLVGIIEQRQALRYTMEEQNLELNNRQSLPVFVQDAGHSFLPMKPVSSAVLDDLDQYMPSRLDQQDNPTFVKMLTSRYVYLSNYAGWG